MRDPRLLPLLMTEMRTKLVEAGVDPDDDEIEKELARKDGKGRFPKLFEQPARAIETQPRLLTATTFESGSNGKKFSSVWKLSGPTRVRFISAAIFRSLRSAKYRALLRK